MDKWIFDRNCLDFWILSCSMAENAIQLRANTLERLNTMIGRIGDAAFHQFDMFQLKTRLDRLKESFAAFEAQNTLVIIDTVDDAARQVFSTEFNDLEDRFLDACATIQRRSAELAQLAQPAAQANAEAGGGAGAPQGQVINVQMPYQFQNIVPTWGKFDGTPMRWIDFKSRFEAGIHNLEGAPNAIKFTYLKDALVGEPKYLIGDGPLDDQGYVDAWEKLCKKYERKYPLASAYLNKLYRLDNLKEQAGATDFQRMSNTVSEVQRQLRALGYPVEHWDFVFVQAIHTRLGPFASKWEEKRGEDDMPTLEKIIGFLDRKADSVRNQRLVNQNTSTVTIRNDRVASQSSSSHGHSSSTNAKVEDKPCGCCNLKGHKIYKCSTFLAMSQKERMQTATDAGLCTLCLKKGHYKRNCLDRTRCPMRECAEDNAHNSLVCPSQGRFTSLHVNTDFSSRSHGRGLTKSMHKRLGDRDES